MTRVSPTHMTEVMPSRTREAYDTIKRRIIEMKLAPGSSFTEGELAAMLKFSKTPVREALVRLRQEGLVEAVARSGYRVVPVTIKQARDLFQVRQLLEVEAAGMAAAHSGDLNDLATLEQLARPRDPASGRNAMRRALRDNTAFHVALARIGGNTIMADMLGRNLEQLERLFAIGISLGSGNDEALHGHGDLLSAVKAGDVESARRLAAEHAAESRLMVLNALLSSDAVLSTNIAAGS